MVVRFRHQTIRRWLWPLLIVSFLLAVIFSSQVMFISKWLIDSLAFGKSTVKVYGFLGYALLYALVYAGGWRLKPRLRHSWLIILLVALFGLSLLSHFMFLTKYGLPFWAQADAVLDNHFSGNHLTHIHTFKPVLVVLGGLVGLAGPSSFYDNGTAFFSLLPHWLYYLGALLLVSLLFLLVGYWRQEQSRLTPKQRWPFTFLYLVSSFVILKNIIDGGFFNKETLIALPIFLFIIWAGSSGYIIRWRQWLLLPISFLALMFFVYALDNLYRADSGFNDLLAVVRQVVVDSALYLIALVLYFYQGRDWLKAALGAAFIFGLLYLLPLPSVNTRVAYWQAVVAAGQTINITSWRPIFDGKLISQEGDLGFYRLTFNQPQRVGDLMDHYQLNLDYYPIDVAGLTCQGSDGTLAYQKIWLIKVIEFEPSFSDFQTVTSSHLSLLSWKRLADKPYPTYVAIVQVPSCTAAPRLAFHNFLVRNGLKSYIVVNP